MLNRQIAFRAAVAAAGMSLLAAVFLPVVFIVFMAGFAPQYGSGSVFTISPAGSVVLMFVVGVALGGLLFGEPRRPGRWLAGMGGLLLGFALLATAYTFSPIAAFGFHPAGMAALGVGGLFLLAAARLGYREGLHPA